MNSFVSIIYSGFWDRPLGFVTQYRDHQFYFHREFDESADEYEDSYKIFLLPNLLNSEITTLWGNLQQKTTRYLGQIPVKEVIFDPSFRTSVSIDTLDNIISKMTFKQ